jgi:exoribonuclease-2
LPELLIRFNPDATLSVDQVDQNSPSRMIVAECMILYNFLAACFCRDQNIPTLFRTQAEPSERLIQGENGYLFYVFRQRRKLSPLQIETEPKPHCGIGLDVYTQTTSPIRRYLDLVVQRQIQSRLLGIPPVCDEEALEEIRLNVGPVLKNLELIKRRRLRYWILKFLSQNRGKPLRAVVLDELMNRYRLVLADSFLVAEIRRENGMQLRPGEEVTVAVRKADHWEDRLDLTLVAENRG